MTFLETLFMILFSVSLGAAIYFGKAYLKAKTEIKHHKETIKLLQDAIFRGKK